MNESSQFGRITSRAVALAAGAMMCFGRAGLAQRTRPIRDVQIAPAQGNLRVGQSQPFFATAYDAVGNPIDNATFEWSSGDPGVVTVDRGGIATGVSAGLAIITVRAGSGAAAKSAQAPVQVVTAAPVAAVAPADAAAKPAAPPVETQRAVTNVPSATVRPVESNTGRPDSLHVYQRSCDGGEASACARLGIMYDEGTGVTPDSLQARRFYAQARDLYQRSCEGGIVRACTGAGWLYATGYATQDYAQARQYLQRGCDGGDADGCTKLGVAFAFGPPVGRDLARSRTFYQRGCDGGNAKGCTKLGEAYETGYGVGRDLAQARMWYQRGCDGGDGSACGSLGIMFEEGTGVSTDREQARRFYQRACDLGFRRGCEWLQQLRR